MGFDDYIEEYGLTLEKNIKASSTDLSKFECSLSKGILSINREVAIVVGLDKKPYIEIYSGMQSGAVVFGIKGVNKESSNTVKVKVLKTKPAKINIARLMLKYNLSPSKDYKVDLVDCSEGYLVFAIIAPVTEKQTTNTQPLAKEEPEYIGSGIMGAQEMVIEGSDF